LKQWIDVDPANVGAVALLVTLFEPAQRFVFIIQAEIKQSSQVANHLAVLTHLIELAQHSPRSILVISVRFGLRPERRHSRAVAAEPMMCVGIVWLELDRSFVFARGSGQIDFAKEEHFSQRRVCFSEIGIKTESFEGGLFRFRTRLAPVCASVKRG